jgi:hypothetical protein
MICISPVFRALNDVKWPLAMAANEGRQYFIPESLSRALNRVHEKPALATI